MDWLVHQRFGLANSKGGSISFDTLLCVKVFLQLFQYDHFSNMDSQGGGKNQTCSFRAVSI